MTAAAALWLAKCVLEASAGPPPTGGAEILAWAEAHRWELALVNELQFFFALLVVLGAVRLHQAWPAPRPVAGPAFLAVAAPVLMMVAVVQARLVYPVSGIVADTPPIAELVVAITAGGTHAVLLILAAGWIALALGLRARRSGRGALAGVAAALLAAVSAYPDSIGPLASLATGAGFALAQALASLSLRDVPLAPDHRGLEAGVAGPG